MSTWQLQFSVEVDSFHLDFDLLSDAKVVALIGPNGSGKSTVIRTIAGAHRPRRGKVALDGRIFVDEDTNLPPEMRRVGYLPQEHVLFPHLSVIENVCFGRDDQNAGLAQLEAVECHDLWSRSAASLSVGEGQRVALARALMMEPNCLLLDEPLSSLDALSKRKLRAWLKAYLHAHALPTMLVTHDLKDVFALADTVCVLEGGRIIEAGPPAALAQSPQSDFTKEFFETIAP